MRGPESQTGSGITAISSLGIDPRAAEKKRTGTHEEGSPTLERVNLSPKATRVRAPHMASDAASRRSHTGSKALERLGQTRSGQASMAPACDPGVFAYAR